ncbi:DNA replication and checkpoint protein-domain-containing protein [Phakopsora pachyrhizi]|uniref:DNA replication regulator SLD2 n=1 Tax=Phakopsora pachyrhizi TaxID=170000 RepID=A0AAV0BL17_PHAPC|nr:DNA replication and checkpoint protein-domain-containing protein [Phakopsora pachyrhizi]CAH7687016.1 DNA replication and checkpoint protein-domain-containing protein [Phakopsora pachyrhizi]
MESNLTVSTSDSTSLKSRLKSWERQFRSTNGRTPNKADIRADPEIARMYSDYNGVKHGVRKTRHPNGTTPNQSSVTVSQKERLAHSTPKKQTRSQTSPKKDENQAIGHGKEASVTSYSLVNSPTKLRKLAQDHSPRKTKNLKRKNTDRHPLSTPGPNPFDSESGGGKGSPNLFADLVIHSKNTPRSKARRFLVGAGSPLKPKKQTSTSDQVNSVNGGLSSFLRPEPQRKSEGELSKLDLNSNKDEKINNNNYEDFNNDDDDNFLGPSPFKPKPANKFGIFFDEDQESKSEHLEVSPISKQLKQKWKIRSHSPFVSHLQQASITSAVVEKDKTLTESGDPKDERKKSVSTFGLKRKRIGAGGDDVKFYEESNLETKNSKSRNLSRSLSKKKAIESTEQGSAIQKTKLSLKVTSKTNQKVFNTGCDDEDEDSELESKLPILPFGDPDQPGVYAELETFTFTTSRKTNDQPVIQKQDSTVEGCMMMDGFQNGEEGSRIDDLRIGKPVKLGTQKVFIRPYRLARTQQIKGEGEDFTSSLLISRESNLEPNPSFSQPRSIQRDEENFRADSSKSLSKECCLTGSQHNLDDRCDDIQISEELLNVLSITDGVSGQDRINLSRERMRELKVRRILGDISLLERTFLNSGNRQSNQNGKAKKDQNRYNTKSIQESGKIVKLQNSLMKDDCTDDQEELKFELAIQERESEEEEEEVGEDDDDWEEEPAGWKSIKHDHGIYSDDT